MTQKYTAKTNRIRAPQSIIITNKNSLSGGKCNSLHGTCVILHIKEKEVSKMEHEYLIKKLKDIKIGHTEKYLKFWELDFYIYK